MKGFDSESWTWQGSIGEDTELDECPCRGDWMMRLRRRTAAGGTFATLTIALSLAVTGIVGVPAWAHRADEASVPDASTIVSLGDSYSSGEANPPFTKATDVKTNRCHWSPLGWPALIGVRADHQLACSGATTTSLSGTPGLSVPDDVSQIERLRRLATDENVKIVTLTIGANDIGFSKIMADCFKGTRVSTKGVGVDRPADPLGLGDQSPHSARG